ncbi:hypothetical protein LTR64_003049 [Lithohypha guttulata]|uniref:uncharacterized protein n=1 Tax=Lithohypha guttulata TaxID=1690604 RepID=UPI00315C8C3C
MSFFHRPSDSSSEEESSEGEEELEPSLQEISQTSTKDSVASAEEIVVPDTTNGTLSLTNTISRGEDGSALDMDEARNMMIASMLEELSRYKAAELLSNTGDGRMVDANSPQILDLAKHLFARSSGLLTQSGVISKDSISDERSSERARYLSALERASYSVGPPDAGPALSGRQGRYDAAIDNSTALVRRPSNHPIPIQNSTAGQLQRLTWELEEMKMVRRSSTEYQLAALAPALHSPSHYRTTFEERGFLGKGGFGKVYRTYNVYDRKEYAVKKIPLSAKLSQKYSKGGVEALKNVLQEVQALAQLDHCNVVRYHATWIEEPAAATLTKVAPQSAVLLPHRGQMLLDNRAASPSTLPQSDSPFNKIDPLPRRDGSISEPLNAGTSFDRQDEQRDGHSHNSFDPFARSENGYRDSKQLWSNQQKVTHHLDRKGITDFSDGSPQQHLSQLSDLSDSPTGYTLHVQMTMYSMSLAGYLRPASSPHKNTKNSEPRHCFHLLPALRLFLSILSGLQYIHSCGFVHRDMKPSNIFLSQLDISKPIAFAIEQGYVDVGSCPSCSHQQPRFLNPRIGDFGLVASLEHDVRQESLHQSGSDSSRTNKVVGTEFYRPPAHEQATDIPNDKIDVFALGVVLIELVFPCNTRMERMSLLKDCQLGQMPAGIQQRLLAEGHEQDVIETLEICMTSMIDPNPLTRWECNTVRGTLESVLARISSRVPIGMQVPD